MFSRIGNPLDLGIFGGMRRAAMVPALLAADRGVGVALALVHSMNPWQGDPIRAALAEAREISGKPLLIVAPGGMPEAERGFYEARGMDVFTETDIVLEGIGALLTPVPDGAGGELAETPLPPWGRGAYSQRQRGYAPLPPARLPQREGEFLRLDPARPLTEPESLRLLREFDVPVVETLECDTFDAARDAADRVGWPVVLKGVAEGVAHKSELGLVRTNLRDADALQSAYKAFGTRRVIVQPMVPGALEAIAGISRSPGVGLVLLCGLGGIYAEALRDVCLWPVPVSRDAIAEQAGAQQPRARAGQPALATSRRAARA